MRLLVGVLAVAVLLAIAAFAHGTTSGLEQDITKGTGQAPDLLIKIAGLASSIAILLVPVAFAIERLIKRDGLRIADGVLAAVLAHGVTPRQLFGLGSPHPDAALLRLSDRHREDTLAVAVPDGHRGSADGGGAGAGGASVPFLRKFVVTRVRSLFAGVVPRMLDVLQRPQKLLTGIGGMLLLTACFVMCLDASIRAFGDETTSISIASVAVVFLAGNALGSAAPTPGGVGAVEATLTVGLIAVGLPSEVAAPSVLLFRLLTLWLPVLPGWLAFNHLTRKGAL
ncbi:hypothetical protein SGLAM104S_06005 [Streptomyces glaucescens]